MFKHFTSGIMFTSSRLESNLIICVIIHVRLLMGIIINLHLHVMFPVVKSVHLITVTVLFVPASIARGGVTVFGKTARSWPTIIFTITLHHKIT